MLKNLWENLLRDLSPKVIIQFDITNLWHLARGFLFTFTSFLILAIWPFHFDDLVVLLIITIFFGGVWVGYEWQDGSKANPGEDIEGANLIDLLCDYVGIGVNFIVVNIIFL